MSRPNYRQIRRFYRKYAKKAFFLLPIILFAILALLFGYDKLMVNAELANQQYKNFEKEQEIHFLKTEIIRNAGESAELKKRIEEIEKQSMKPLPVRLAKKMFGKDAVTFLAIIKSESGLNPRAMGFNCHYDGKSKACAVADRGNAWSVDCGISQINIAGNTCPEYTFDIKWNMNEAYKKYSRRGFQPWVVFNTGKHLSNISWAREQII